jgi:hypothetical protein
MDGTSGVAVAASPSPGVVPDQPGSNDKGCAGSSPISSPIEASTGSTPDHESGPSTTPTRSSPETEGIARVVTDAVKIGSTAARREQWRTEGTRVQTTV